MKLSSHSDTASDGGQLQQQQQQTRQAKAAATEQQGYIIYAIKCHHNDRQYQGRGWSRGLTGHRNQPGRVGSAPRASAT
jgi:hypothetical protein